jgi:hypothetical protein
MMSTRCAPAGDSHVSNKQKQKKADATPLRMIVPPNFEGTI